MRVGAVFLDIEKVSSLAITPIAQPIILKFLKDGK